jgi:uncharacterized membrane protein
MRSKLLTYSGWVIIWILSFYFIYTNALRYFNVNDRVYTPEFKPFTPFIMLHVAGGIVALVVGPLQFFDTIRRKYTSFHRLIGKTYLIAVVVSAVFSVYLAVFDNLLTKKDLMFSSGVLGMALAWLITAGMAYWAIKKRNINQHKEWMIRSYVVTTNFIIFRLILYGLLSIENFPFKDQLGGFTIWVSWSIPLLITEMILQGNKITRSKQRSNSSSVKPVSDTINV